MGEPIIAHVIPTATQSREVFDGGFGILVTTSTSAPGPPDTAIIQGLFDLTPAEARVACGILAGMTGNEMAERYGVVRETVRTQVKAVLAKTGSRRQVEAAAKLALLPRISPVTAATKVSAEAIPPPAPGSCPATVLQFRARGHLARGAISK